MSKLKILHKSPTAKNRENGNVSMSQNDFWNIKIGHYTHIQLDDEKPFKIKRWMTAVAEERYTYVESQDKYKYYVVFPFTTESTLFNK